MDIRKVKKLIELLEESNIDEIEIKEGPHPLRHRQQHPNLRRRPHLQPAVTW
jgi:hypothetical protein